MKEKEQTGLTPKEIAAITACVPCSGTPYIDAIITQGLRFRTATAAMESIIINEDAKGKFRPDGVAAASIAYADALIAAFRSPTERKAERSEASEKEDA